MNSEFNKFDSVLKKLSRDDICLEYMNCIIYPKKGNLHTYKKTNVILTIENGKLIFHPKDDLKIDYTIAILILYFFDTYDSKNQLLYTTNIVNIKNFLYSGNVNFKKYGIELLFQFDNFELANVLSKILYYHNSNDNINKKTLEEIFFNYTNINEFECNIEKFINNINLYSDYINLNRFSHGNFFLYLDKEVHNADEKRFKDVKNNFLKKKLPSDYINKYDSIKKYENIHFDDLNIALDSSLLELGIVDIEYISKVTGKKLVDCIDGLKDVIIQNPEEIKDKFYLGWVLKSEYLTGNLKHKMDVAIKFNDDYAGAFNENINLLKSFVDKSRWTNDFTITLSSPFIPLKYISDFYVSVIQGRKKMGHRNGNCETIFRDDGKYDSYGMRRIASKMYQSIFEQMRALAKFGFTKNDYGSKKSSSIQYRDISVAEMLENLINGKLNYVEYFDYEKNHSYVDDEMTLLIREKEKKLNDEFIKYIKENKYFDEIVSIFNKKFNCYFYNRVYNEKHLKFEGKNENLVLYEHQKKAISKIVFSKNILLAHNVGSGKTYVMIAAGMELRYKGISKKNMYVVPNNVLGQWRDMFFYAYPNANILYIDNKKFTKRTKNMFLKDIIDNDYDAIIIAYSSFDKINSKNIEVYNYKKDKVKSEDEIFFEDLNINTLFIDEAHNYKNIPIKTTMTKILGINTQGSKKCTNLLSKIRSIHKNNNGRGVVFATGTPITNSISDIYNLQLYLQEDDLILSEVETFDKWRGVFATINSNFEVDLDAKRYRIANRFNEYHNVVELTKMFSLVADYYENTDKNKSIPDYDGYIDVLSEKTTELKKYLLDIAERIDKIRKGEVNIHDDNMLKITTDGRKAALDMRIVDDDLKNYKSEKIDKCVDNIVKIYNETNDKKSTQIIFCDLSVSALYSQINKNKDFTVYDELKKLMIKSGILESEIAFIHEGTTDVKKSMLFDDFNSGKIRVMIGSTFKLGMGVNLQKKLIAVHHLDVPWRPADMTQREGRILREGNENKKVYIYRYITKGTFDAYSWQLLETKQKFITQILTSQMKLSKISEIDDTVLNYAEAKALAVENLLIKEKFEILNKINRLEILKRNFIESHESVQDEAKDIDIKIEENNKKIALLEKDVALREDKKINTRMKNEERIDIESQIYTKIFENFDKNEDMFIVKYKGFDLYVPQGNNPNEIMLKIAGSINYYIPIGQDKSKYIEKVDKKLNSIKSELEKLRGINDKLLSDKSYAMNVSKNETFEDSENLDAFYERLKEIDEKLGINI